MPGFDPRPFADELSAAYAARRTDVQPFSARDPAFDLASGYEVEAELARRRRERGRSVVGRKVGFANKAVWRALKLETLVWARMYDDTVRFADAGGATLSVARMVSPRIEPEIVFRLARVPGPDERSDAPAILAAIDWLALGFEIIDAVYAGWTFRPPDFIAAYGLHAALVVGEPLRVEPGEIPALAEALARFEVTLSKDSDLVARGSGKNVLRSPALCLAELVGAVARHPRADPLTPGEIISSGTLTESQPIVAGQTWTAAVSGLDLPPLTLQVIA